MLGLAVAIEGSFLQLRSAERREGNTVEIIHQMGRDLTGIRCSSRLPILVLLCVSKSHAASVPCFRAFGGPKDFLQQEPGWAYPGACGEGTGVGQVFKASLEYGML